MLLSIKSWIRASWGWRDT